MITPTRHHGRAAQPSRLAPAFDVLRRRAWVIVGPSLVAGAVAAAVTIAVAGPSWPLAVAIAVAAAAFTLMLASAVALVAEGGPVRAAPGPHAVAAALGVAPLALVPRVEREGHILVREQPSSAYAAAVRDVLAALAAASPPPKVVLVTSALPGEGKTTLSASLAALAAADGARVLLIDLDLRQPNVHRKLGHDDDAMGAGIVEHVEGGRPLADVIRRDEATGLDFLPVHARTLDPHELIEGEAMRALIERARADYDRVVIDAAPVGVITDTLLAARLADQVLFVIRADGGPRVASVAREGLGKLRAAGIEPAGAVFTLVEPS